MAKVDASDLCRLLLKRATSAAQHRGARSPSPALKSEVIREPAPAATPAVAPVAPLPVPHPLPHHQQLLSADEEIAAHRKKHARYFTMLRVGIPRETVEQAMRLAGVDPVELDGPHLVVETTSTTICGGSAGLSGDPSSLAGVPGSGSGGLGHHHHTLGRKKALRKRLYWDVKVHDSSLEGEANRRGIWSHADQPAVAVTVSDETKVLLEKLFVKESIAPDSEFKSSAVNEKKAPARISLVDTKKAQNVGIALARIKISLPELVRELVNMNPTVLCAAQLQGLLDMWPDRKELEAIDEFTEDKALLGTAEQFFLETRGIPRFREKLGCLIFKQEFPLRVHELRESINLVIRGINQVCSSLALQQIMSFILQLGNFLNFGGTLSDSLAQHHHQHPLQHQAVAPRVVGFSLSSLAKLGQTKAFTGGATFLQFAIQAVDRDCPHLAHFHKEINLVPKCAKVSIQSLVSEQKALETGWEALVHEAQTGISAAALDDGDERCLSKTSEDSLIVSSILTHFAAEVENELDAIQELLERLVESKQQFLEFFDEQDSADELDVLLRYIARFADEFVQQRI